MGISSLWSFKAQAKMVKKEEEAFSRGKIGKGIGYALLARGNGLMGCIVTPISTVIGVALCGIIGVVATVAGPIFSVGTCCCCCRPEAGVATFVGGPLIGVSCVIIGGAALVSGTVGTAAKVVSLVSPELVAKPMAKVEAWETRVREERMRRN